jgi:hypothetical protein
VADVAADVAGCCHGLHASLTVATTLVRAANLVAQSVGRLTLRESQKIEPGPSGEGGRGRSVTTII